MSKDIWVMAETSEQRITEQTKELLGLAGSRTCSEKQKISALLFGEHPDSLADELAAYGAQQVIALRDRKLQNYQSDLYLQALLHALQQNTTPSLILFPISINARDLAALLAAHLQTSFIPACISFTWLNGEHLRVTRLIFHGQAQITQNLKIQNPTLLGFPYRFRGIEPPSHSNQPEIKYLYPKISGNNRIRHVRTVSSGIEEIDLNEADKVICGGAGLGDQDMFSTLWELGALLNAPVGGSRVAVDKGWIPYERMIGISGKTLQGNLYLGFGVSGAIQHLSGITDCSTLVAIDKNSQTPLMNIADLAVIGDVRDILPLMINKLKKPASEDNENNQQ